MKSNFHLELDLSSLADVGYAILFVFGLIILTKLTLHLFAVLKKKLREKPRE